MLIAFFVMSAFLVIAAQIAARPAPHGVRGAVFGLAAAFLIGVPFLLAQVLLTALVIESVLLASFLAWWPRWRSHIPSFLPLSLASVFAALGIGLAIGAIHNQMFDSLREAYPLESMAERVPEPEPSNVPVERLEERLVMLETEIRGERGGMRSEMLKRLHDDTISRFVNSPGFGIGRRFEPSEFSLRSRDRGEPAKQTIEFPRDFAARTISAAEEPDLQKLHTAHILDFVNVEGFGFAKSPRRAAGFVAHGFGDERESDSKWVASRTELISLLLHKKPVVYLSDRLPAMEQLRQAKTRDLDPFELVALEAIRTGSELTVSEGNSEVRMVGAIRNAKQCVECHGGKRGDLLGAFSYTLQRK